LRPIATFEVIDHGVGHPDSFQGCDVAHTRFDEAHTGIGYTPRQALEDAIYQAACFGWDVEALEATQEFQDARSALSDVTDSILCHHVSIRVAAGVEE
jgi:hypothetical protein